MKNILVGIAIGTVLLIITHQTISAQKPKVSIFIPTQVYVKGNNNRYHSLDDLRSVAEHTLDIKMTNMIWTDVREVIANVDRTNPTNLVKFFFSCGLGKESFLVSFDRNGKLAHVYKGKEVD